MQAEIRAKLYRSERAADRIPLGRGSTMRGYAGIPVDVIIDDLSATGCRLRVDNPPEPGETVCVGMAGVGMRLAEVIWRDETLAGCAFVEALSRQDLEDTLAANTVVAGAFAAPEGIAFDPDAPLILHPGPRARLFAIIGAAIMAWLVVALAAWVLVATLI